MPSESSMAIGRAALAFLAAMGLLSVGRGPWTVRFTAGWLAAWGFALLLAANLRFPQVVDLVFAPWLAIVLLVEALRAFRQLSKRTPENVLWHVAAFPAGMALTQGGMTAAFLDAPYPAAVSAALAFSIGAVGLLCWAARLARQEHDEEVAGLRLRIEELQAAARHDALTGLLNRRAYENLRDAPLPGFAGAVAAIDLEGFKAINDTYGHAAGDAALQAAARALLARVRASDFVFRWGGDEFVAILPGGSCEDAERRLAEVAAALSGVRLSAEAPRVAVGLTWGTAAFDGAEELDAAIAAADRAMYGRRRHRSDPDARQGPQG